VKSLSQQTGRATDDIRSRIERLRGEIKAIMTSMKEGGAAAQNGQSVIDDLGQGIDALGTSVRRVAGRMSELSHVIGEQTIATQAIAKNVGDIAASTKQNVSEVKKFSEQMDNGQKIVGEQMQCLAELTLPNKVPRLAKADHVIWKKRLADMAVGRVTLRPEELADHHSCRLGKWYYGELSAPYRGCTAFVALEQPHAMVHTHGKEAARLFERGDLDGALAEIEKVEDASKGVLRLLDELMREAALGAR
jgi:methyl-accepting chemotaxis protein